LLYFGPFSLLVSALLLNVSTLEKRPELRLHLRDRSREVGQLASDHRDVLLGCHCAKSLRPPGKISRIATEHHELAAGAPPLPAGT
jgi:hypothetical protein